MPRVMVVLGASRGIGLATARALARPDNHLVLGARDLAALERLAAELRAMGVLVTPHSCDVTRPADVAALVAHAADLTGQIDLLVNSAGVAAIAPFEELALEQWEQTLRVGLTGAFLTCQQAARHMRPGGLIVNVASVAARQAFPGWSAYCAAKAGLLAFSNVLREELRPRGVRVTVVLPAATDTALWDTLPGNWNRANMLQPADVAAAIAQIADQPSTMTTEELVVGHVAGRL
ncbi:MAG TPA: SDR family NAD(P)-dependent oxidoreductase [Roseiflexaceae bacterium]|nr:SDR family NAD(P)-dependent oxidoreductase [Roseiflexaceae bacterium]